MQPQKTKPAPGTELLARRTVFEVSPFDPLSWLGGEFKSRRSLLFAGVVLVLAALAAEGLLRLLLPYQMAFGETWFAPGIHRPDPKFGYVFAPNYQGWMFYGEKVIHVPIQHDEHGFRPAATTPGGRNPSHVVLLGGKSMAYGFGLPDADTPHTAMSQASTRPLTVHCVAWPGFSEQMMFAAYRDLLEPNIPKPELVILLLYQVKLRAYAGLPEDFRSLPAPPSTSELFNAGPGLVVPPRPPPSGWLGSGYYRSYLLARLATLADTLTARWQSSEPEVRSPEEQEKALVGLRKFSGFVGHLHSYFRERGVRFLVVGLPVSYPNANYTGIWRALPPGVPHLDLQAELRPTWKAEDFIAGDHYGPRAARALGQRLAEETDRILSTPPPSQQ